MPETFIFKSKIFFLFCICLSHPIVPYQFLVLFRHRKDWNCPCCSWIRPSFLLSCLYLHDTAPVSGSFPGRWNSPCSIGRSRLFSFLSNPTGPRRWLPSACGFFTLALPLLHHTCSGGICHFSLLTLKRALRRLLGSLMLLTSKLID